MGVNDTEHDFTRFDSYDVDADATWEVYLPVAMTIDANGELVGRPAIDFDGMPWSDFSNGANVWHADVELYEDEAEWIKDDVKEADAIVQLDELLGKWGDT